MQDVDRNQTLMNVVSWVNNSFKIEILLDEYM